MDDLVGELNAVREVRSSPPVGANTDRRVKVFASALQQFEELVLAAQNVGAASKPLLLFYALSQAGRAISAGHFGGQGWEATGHGLQITGQSQAIKDLMVRADGKAQGAFTLAGQCLASAPLTAPVSLADAWASLPHIGDSPALTGARHRPLPVHPSFGHAVGQGKVVFEDNIELNADPSDVAAVEEALKAYRLRDSWTVEPSPDRMGAGVRVRFVWNGAEPFDGNQRLLIGEEIIGGQFMRPTVNSNGDLPHILMTYWLALFALAHAARYTPSEWVGALNVDKSAIAAPLELGLTSMTRVLPRLVRDAIVAPL